MEVFCFVCLETFFLCARMFYESVCELVLSGQENILKQESGSISKSTVCGGLSKQN